VLASPSANSGFVCGSKFQKSEILGVGAAKEVTARLAQSVERKTLNLVVVGSSPTLGVFWFLFRCCLGWSRSARLRRLGRERMPS
jgi:hypothetical protein